MTVYHRRSLRLKGNDYSREGCYFITICTQGKEHLTWNEDTFKPVGAESISAQIYMQKNID